MPDFLEAANKDENDFIYLTVNMADDWEKWIEYSEKYLREAAITNIRIDQSQAQKLFKEYHFDSIPHYVVIGKDKKLIIKGVNRFKSSVWPYLGEIKQ
jgi:hypothetical protein